MKTCTARDCRKAVPCRNRSGGAVAGSGVPELLQQRRCANPAEADPRKPKVDYRAAESLTADFAGNRRSRKEKKKQKEKSAAAGKPYRPRLPTAFPTGSACQLPTDFPTPCGHGEIYGQLWKRLWTPAAPARQGCAPQGRPCRSELRCCTLLGVRYIFFNNFHGDAVCSGSGYVVWVQTVPKRKKRDNT